MLRLRRTRLPAWLLYLGHEISGVGGEHIREMENGGKGRHVAAALQHAEVRCALATDAGQVFERPRARSAEAVDDRTKTYGVLIDRSVRRHGTKGSAFGRTRSAIELIPSRDGIHTIGDSHRSDPEMGFTRCRIASVCSRNGIHAMADRIDPIPG